MSGVGKMLKKSLGEMKFNKIGGNINWFPGHMVPATRAINARLKLADLVIEVRDSRLPLTSANQDLQSRLSSKLRVIALNKKDLANINVLPKWIDYFNSCKQDCLPVNAHNRSCVQKLLELVELKLKEKIAKEPTLIVMVVGVPNVGKSALINCIHQIASRRFPAPEKKRAKVGPLPGVTQDIAGFKIAQRPSIYVLDTPGVLVPSIPNVETGLKLALAGSVKDSVVGEERIAQYLLAFLNSRKTPLHWKNLHYKTLIERHNITAEKHVYNIRDILPKKRAALNELSSASRHVEGLTNQVKSALYTTVSECRGDVEDEDVMEALIEEQFEALQRAFKVSHKPNEARMVVSKKFLTLFRAGKLGPFILDDIPVVTSKS